MNAEKRSEIRGFFRSGTMWAEHAETIQEAIERRGLKVSVVIAVDEPVLATTEDWGLPDIEPAAVKFRSIRVSSSSGGWFRLYRTPVMLPLSYQQWQPEGEDPRGMLTCGANIRGDKKQALILADSHPFKKCLDALYEQILAASSLVWQSPVPEGGSPSALAAGRRTRIFIASSKHAEHIAHAIQGHLEQPQTCHAQCTVWTDNAFQLSITTLDNLRILARSDFGIFVFAPDDVAVVNGTLTQVPRDNLVFEAGLFCGHAAPERCFIVIPKTASIHIPTDLAGVTLGFYDDRRDDGNYAASVATFCSQVVGRVVHLRQRNIFTERTR